MDLFEQNFTRERQIASMNALQPESMRSQLERVKKACPATSRQIARVTGIDRTSVCRVIAENKAEFDDSASTFDTVTRRTVTVYQVKSENRNG